MGFTAFMRHMEHANEHHIIGKNLAFLGIRDGGLTKKEHFLSLHHVTSQCTPGPPLPPGAAAAGPLCQPPPVPPSWPAALPPLAAAPPDAAAPEEKGTHT